MPDTAQSPAPGPDLSELLDLSPIPALVLSPDLRILRATRSLVNAWELSGDGWAGQDVFDVLASQGVVYTANDRAGLLTSLNEAIKSRKVRPVTAIYRRKGSAWSTRIIPIFRGDELLSLVLEWEESASENSGLSTDEAFRILVQAVKDYAIFFLDTHGNIATWNTGAELHKGYKKEEIIGKHFSIFYGEDDLRAQKPAKELEVCLQDGRVEDEGWRYRKDGSRFWANVVITAIYNNGSHVGFGKVTRDLTERRAAELRLIAAYEESAKLKSDFLANMSHEIRTPMHGMLSACSLLLDTPLTPEQRDTAGIIGESGQVLLQVINDILDYSKLASGNFSIHADVVGVASIITSVVRSEQTTLEPAVHFELLLEPNLPKSVQGDPLRYRQIVQNIIGNASKFTERGYISVKASLESEDEDNCVILTQVTDTGIGISDASARNLFSPFTQLEEMTKKRYQGTGLGLSICKSLVELMGGQIGFRPNPERHGSIFWFTAKFKKIKSLDQIQTLKEQPRAALVRPTAPSPTPGPVPATDPVQILKELAPTKQLLVVEDNIINQKVLLKTLYALRFTGIAVATDGAQAVKMVLEAPKEYDLILMDINMPVMDGHEATVRIRESGNSVPIVAMTAHALKGHIEQCLEKGMDDYIPKPMDRQRVVRTLLRWLPRNDDNTTGKSAPAPADTTTTASNPVETSVASSNPAETATTSCNPIEITTTSNPAKTTLTSNPAEAKSVGERKDGAGTPSEVILTTETATIPEHAPGSDKSHSRADYHPAEV